MPLFRQAKFFKSAASLADLPRESVREVAFAGRSNAGKSSAMNTLAGHHQLARVSKTPGRTQLLNYFELKSGRFLVDLPGYGYAKVPVAIRAPWDQLLGAYVRTRDALAGIVLVMDARHPMTQLDRALLDWFLPTGKPVHVLLTKSDKLSRSRAIQTLREVRNALRFESPNWTVQLFSSLKKSGIDEADEMLGTWLGITDSVAKPEQASPGAGRPGSSLRNRGHKNEKPPGVSLRNSGRRSPGPRNKKPRAKGE